MAKNELKKCPCCNGPAIYNEDLNSFYAECHHCQLRTASYRTKDRAAEIWNTRILEAELKQHEWTSIEDGFPENIEAKYQVSDGIDSWEDDWIECNNVAWWWDKDDYNVTHWRKIILPEVE